MKKILFGLSVGLFAIQSHASDGRQILRCAAPSGLSSPAEIQLVGADIQSGKIGHRSYMRVDGQFVNFSAELSGDVTLLSAVSEGSNIKSTYLVPLKFDVPADKTDLKKYIDTTYLCFTYQ